MNKNIRKLLLAELFPPRPKSNKNSFKFKNKKLPFSFSSQNCLEAKNKTKNDSNTLSILKNSLNSPKKSKTITNSFYKTGIKGFLNKNNISISKYNSKNNSIISYNKSKKKIRPISASYNKNLEQKTIDTNIQAYTDLSRVFKFEKNNSLTKFLQKRKKIITSIYSKKYYKDYINKKLLLNFNLKYNTAFMHKIKTDYAISCFLKNTSNHVKKSKKQKLKEEEKDKVNLDFFKIEKVSKKIINSFENLNKKYSTSEETVNSFFKKYDNQINFIKDINSVPFFKNKLIRFGDDIFSDKLDQNNYVDQKTWKYLNKIKINLQKIKDEKTKDKLFVDEDDEIKLKRTKNEIRNEKFDAMSYLVHKKNVQSIVSIPSNQEKKLFQEMYLEKHKIGKKK